MDRAHRNVVSKIIYLKMYLKYLKFKILYLIFLILHIHDLFLNGENQELF